MIVIVRFEVSDEQRAAVRRSKGEHGLATRQEIASLAEIGLEQNLDDAVAAYPAGAHRKAP